MLAEEVGFSPNRSLRELFVMPSPSIYFKQACIYVDQSLSSICILVKSKYENTISPSRPDPSCLPFSRPSWTPCIPPAWRSISTQPIWSWWRGTIRSRPSTTSRSTSSTPMPRTAGCSAVSTRRPFTTARWILRRRPSSSCRWARGTWISPHT